jgi:hypothetical protein
MAESAPMTHYVGSKKKPKPKNKPQQKPAKTRPGY